MKRVIGFDKGISKRRIDIRGHFNVESDWNLQVRMML